MVLAIRYWLYDICYTVLVVCDMYYTVLEIPCCFAVCCVHRCTGDNAKLLMLMAGDSCTPVLWIEIFYNCVM